MIAVWFSNGAPSACAAKLAIDRYGKDQVRVVNNPVAEEDSDNLRFGQDVADWLDVKIERATFSGYPDASAKSVWAGERGMSFPKGAPCTRLLKRRARQEWEARNRVDWHVFGFTVEEKDRHARFVLTERENVLPMLIDAGMTRAMCGDMIRAAGLKLPRVYNLGFPNANCIGCVKATSPTYWNLVRRTFPDVFEDRAKQSRELGAKLVRVQNKRIYLDELSPTAKGRKINTMPECGLFCEEPNAPSTAPQSEDHAND